MSKIKPEIEYKESENSQESNLSQSDNEEKEENVP